MDETSFNESVVEVPFWDRLSLRGKDEGPTTVAYMELAWIFFTYTYILSKLTFPKMRKIVKYPGHRCLIVHIILPIIEAFRYHIRSIWGPVVPDVFDLCLSLSHSYTSIIAARDRKIGDKTLTRPCHQTIAFTRITCSIMAYTLQNAFFNQASIRILNAFFYPRLLIYTIGKLNVLPQYSNVYAASIFLSSVLVLHDGGLPFGPHLFLTVYVVNILVNRWAATKVVEG
jgi:hypothetical protein